MSESPELNPLWLTFDDGPTAHFEEQVLPLLSRFQVKAVFFFCGKLAEKYPHVVEEVSRQGHEIGNHTWDHPRLTRLQAGEIKEQIERTSWLLHSLTHKPVQYFRPPYGAMNSMVSAIIAEMNLTNVLWTLDPQDWRGHRPRRTFRFLSSRTRRGDIILLHSMHTTLKVLPQLLESYQRNGFQMDWPPALSFSYLKRLRPLTI